MDRVPLPGSERQAPPGSRIGTPSPNERLLVSVVLRPRSSKGEPFPQRPANQRLSHEELEAVYGADPQDIARVEDFAMANNLSVDGVYPARRTVDLSGTTADLMKAFQVDLALYEFEGKTFCGHGGLTHVPRELVPIIQGIFGLDNRPIVRRHFASPIVINSLPDVAAAYNFPTGVDGTGQTIGILAAEGGFDQNDLNLFWQGLGIVNLPQVVVVPIDGTVNNPGQDTGADKEVTFDIQIASGTAPGAKIVAYFFPNTISGQLHAIQTAVRDINNAPSVISMSLGLTESGSFLGLLFTARDRLVFDQVYQDAAARSITLLCSTGDFGSTNAETDGQQHVCFPASSPNLTACGGSVLTIGGGAIASEIVWNEAPTTAATGGGVSDAFPRPNYQSNANVPLSTNGFTGRGIPDVAGHAAGISVVFNGAADKFAGTSAVSPLWAGLIARINQLKGQRTGFLNDILYGRLAPLGTLNDITLGDNGFYQARPGWDACTGLGSPNGGGIAALIGPPTISFLSPTAGPVGGGIFITIRGSRLFGASLISFGGTDTKDFRVDDDTQITVRLPQNIGDGTVTVTVTTPSGTGGGSPNSDFSYVFPVPVIQSINPPSGGVAGGYAVNINGLSFTGATSVGFNKAGVIPNTVTDNQITVAVPIALGSGPVDVEVTTPGGTSAPRQFAYVFPTPAVSSVGPATGGVGGGVPVTIVGTGFTGVILVDFGGALQPQPFTFVDDTHITLLSPPGNGPGPVDVRVTTLGGTSNINPGDEFTYF